MSAEEEALHSQVGQSAGAGRLDVLQQRVWLAIYCALGAGVIAFGALAGLQFPVSAFFALSSEVRISLLPPSMRCIHMQDACHALHILPGYRFLPLGIS